MKIIKILLASLLAILLLLGAGVGYLAVTDPYDCRIMEGVTVGGLELGGMYPWEAYNALETALNDSLLTQPLTVQLPKETLTLVPGDCVLRVDTLQALWDAFGMGRREIKQSILTPELPLLSYVTLNGEGIRQTLSAYASRQDTDLIQPAWKLTGAAPELGTDVYDPNVSGQTLVLTMGIPKVRLNVEEVYAAIAAVYENAIPACSNGAFTLVPEVPPEILPEVPDMAKIAGEVNLPPVDDSLDMSTYGFVHGSYGYGFDPEAAQAQVTEAAFGQTLEFPLTASQPEVFGEDVYFRDILGHCETRHTDDENRNTNLRLLCAALDGHIIEPGQEFSFNEVVGERSEERGYKPATVYSGSRISKDFGGGACQGSTTLYNCALLADVEVTQRVCHGAKVGYVPLGLDAAVNWLTNTDLKFKNNFHFPMMIKAEVSDGYVKMQLLGTDEKDYYIEMKAGNSSEGDITYAVSRKYKYDKVTGELISKDVEAYSTYYPIS